MFSWFRGGARAGQTGTWNVAPSPDHTYVVFGDANLPAHVAPALAELDASLAAASEENREEMDDPKFVDDFDDEGAVRRLVAGHVTVEPVADVAAARNAAIDPAELAEATHAVRVRATADDCLGVRVPYALLGAAAAIARAAGAAQVSDTLGLRLLSGELIADPFAGLPLGSVGPHVTIVPMNDPDGTLSFTTVGLAKYGMFDVTLSGVPASLPRASEIVAAFAQSIVSDIPARPGPWKPDVCRVSATDTSFFYDRNDTDPAKPTYVHLRAHPLPDESHIWALTGEKRPLDAAAIATILRTFDADRAAAPAATP